MNLDLPSSSDEREGEGSGSDEESDSDEDDDDFHQLQEHLRRKSGRKELELGLESSEEEEGGEEEENAGWGTQKRSFYQSEYADEVDDDEMAEEEVS